MEGDGGGESERDCDGHLAHCVSNQDWLGVVHNHRVARNLYLTFWKCCPGFGTRLQSSTLLIDLCLF